MAENQVTCPKNVKLAKFDFMTYLETFIREHLVDLEKRKTKFYIKNGNIERMPKDYRRNLLGKEAVKWRLLFVGEKVLKPANLWLLVIHSLVDGQPGLNKISANSDLFFWPKLKLKDSKPAQLASTLVKFYGGIFPVRK